MPTYYRLFARKCRYHLPGPQWTRTGRALCGTDLSHPSHFVNAAWEIPASRRICLRCLAADTKRRALYALRNPHDYRDDPFEGG